MGIKNLNNIIAEFTTINPQNKCSLKRFINKTMAIDANLYIYKFLYANGNHLNGLFFMINKLSKFKIKPIFIFDGYAPTEKDATIKHRRNIKKKIKTQVIGLKADLLIVNGIAARTAIIKKITNLEKRLVYVDSEVLASSKKLLNLMGILYFEAPSEAEQLCSILSRFNLVDGVISDDTDTLACGSKIMLRNFSNKFDEVSVYYMNDVLYELDLNYNSFLDLCILLGTDYNNKLKNVSFKDMYKLIHKYKTIEAILLNTRHTIRYDYGKIRSIFKSSDIPSHIKDAIEISRAEDFKPKINIYTLLAYLKKNTTINPSTLLFRLNKMYSGQAITSIPNKYSCFDSQYKIDFNKYSK